MTVLVTEDEISFILYMGPSWITVLVIEDKIDAFAPKLIFFSLQLNVSFYISRLFKQIKMQFSYYNKKT